jgi:hypothetical protein
MKIKNIILAGTLIATCLKTLAQDCDKLLQGGLYSFTKMTNTGHFSQDLKTYYLSDQFKLDMKNGKWGSSLTIPIVGIPISLEMDYSDNQYSEFRSKILSTTDLSIDQSFYQTSFSSIPNTNLYDAYVKCVDISRQNGLSGFVQGLNVETEDAVVFTIYFKPSNPGDPMPVVQGFNVEPTNSIISGGLVAGQRLSGYSILVTCKRIQDKDLILTLQTDRGSISSKVPAPDGLATSKELPIGTVITSFLNFEQFNIASKNNDKSPGSIWTAQKSKWAPCDGRPVPLSGYQKLTAQVNLPDLRGIFLRGLNTFDPYQPVPVKKPEDGDPDNRNNAGQSQNDAFQNHKHNYSAMTYQNPSPGYNLSHTGQYCEFREPSTSGPVANGAGDPRTATETRPKNVTVYYYIKIN